jgi:hypothetical protein
MLLEFFYDGFSFIGLLVKDDRCQTRAVNYSCDLLLRGLVAPVNYKNLAAKF